MARARRQREENEGVRQEQGRGKYFMISVVANNYGIHPQTLRLYEREGLLKPSRTEGNTRLYSEDDLRQLEVILNLTRDLGVNLAGVEIVLNMRKKLEQMQSEFAGFLRELKDELMRTSREGWEEKLEQALVRIPPSPLVRTTVEGQG
jgi:MerR family transcriptional regulator/heat shock protein HspR